ncbi:MAG: F0F1 ATP synthase subunit A [candidate division KSB1 bacterium]|nr:F0F1 ATP synthase subunit A [candidate division KSB1 bacterium]
MVLNFVFTLIQQHQTAHGEEAAAAAGHGAEQGTGEFILHHISDQPLVHLPTVFGIDLSITKHVLMMWISAVLMLALFSVLFGRAKLVPRGLANMFEAIIVFLREDVVKPYLGNDGHRFEPYLYTVFFFILFNNLMGLIPGGASATGNISVTAALAILTFLIGLLAGMKAHGAFGFFKGLVPPGLPKVLVPLLFVVEIMGLITKHFALAIRLFANMTAGHVVILALISLIFLFKSYLIALLPLVGAVGIGLLEVLVAMIQAYIFTMLSAVFIGAAIHQEH